MSNRYFLLSLLVVLLCGTMAWAEGSWPKFPTESDINGAVSNCFAASDSADLFTLENLTFVKYHDPTVDDPLKASGVLLVYDLVYIEESWNYPLDNEYWVGFLKYDKWGKFVPLGEAGWKGLFGRRFESAAERDQFVGSLWQSNPPVINHPLGDDGSYLERPDPSAAYRRGWADPKEIEPPPVVVDRISLSVNSTRVSESWLDASGRETAKVVIEATVQSESPIVSTTFYRLVPGQKQGYVKLHDGSLVAEVEALAGKENTFVLALYNEADQSAERTFTISPEGSLIAQSGADDVGPVGPLEDFVEDVLEEQPALGEVGSLPGPRTTVEGVAGVLLPGLISILIGLLGGPQGPEIPETQPDSPSVYPPGTEHTLSDGRIYREGESYIFHDGVEYEVRDGELVPKRELRQGEHFVDPDGEERVWQGNQAWIPSDWERQAQTNREYEEAHRAHWEVEKSQVDSRMAEAMQNIKEDYEMLENLEKMRHEAIFGPQEVRVLGKDTPGGGFRGKIDRVLADFESTGEMDREAYRQIRKVYGKARTGQIASESELRTETQIIADTMRGATDRIGREVVTGVDSEGNVSYKSAAVRILTGILTAGSSEMVYTPANSVYTMKDYVDQGGNSAYEGFKRTVKDVVIGEIIGNLTGRGLQKFGKGLGRVAKVMGEAAEEVYPEATRAAIKRVKKLVDVLTKQRRSPFASKVQPPPKIPGKVSPRPTRAEVTDRLKQYKAAQSRATPGLEIDESSFKPAGKPADLRGVPLRDQKAIQMVSHKHGVKAQFRPTNPDSKPWLETGRGHPKPEMLKTKTISRKYDTRLGFSEDKVGTVACKKPVMPSKRPPDFTDAEFRELKERFLERSAEYLDQEAKLDALVNKGKISWNKQTGDIVNPKTGKPFAGDNDAFGFVDAVTGKPVSPTVNRQINQDLQNLGATTHGEHLAWDYSKLSKVPEAGAPPGAQSPYDIASGIDKKILGKHQQGGEALNTYNPLDGDKGGWSTSYWNGGTRDLP